MNAYKVTASHAFNKWHDFTFVYAQSKKLAILKAMEEMDFPEIENDKIVITVSMEGQFGKKKRYGG